MNNISQMTVTEVAQALKPMRRRSYVRACLSTETDPPSLRYADIIVGKPPPQWREDAWRYEPLVFVADTVTSGQLADAISPPRGDLSVLSLNGIVAAVDISPDERLSCQRRPSHAVHDRTELDWPSHELQLGLADRNHQWPHGFLTSAAASSFAAAAAAFNAFFYGDYRVTGANAPSLGQVQLRLIDDQARLGRVRVGPTVLSARIDGRGVAGTVVQLNGVTGPLTFVVDRAGVVNIPLPDGLPSDAWLWLLRETQWLDFRSLGGWPAYETRDVTYETTYDPAAELASLIASGEGQHLEFKEKLPETPDQKRKTFKTVGAFANGGGGTILFGVDDNGRMRGLSGHIDELRSTLINLLRDLMIPTPAFELSSHLLDGRQLLALSVETNNGQVYAVAVEKNKPEYYVRRGSTTFFARPEEIDAIVRSSATTPQSFPFR